MCSIVLEDRLAQKQAGNEEQEAGEEESFGYAGDRGYEITETKNSCNDRSS